MLQAPDSHILEKFLGRLPLIFNVAILSPHGFFGSVLCRKTAYCLSGLSSALRTSSFDMQLKRLKSLHNITPGLKHPHECRQKDVLGKPDTGGQVTDLRLIPCQEA